MDTFDSRQLAAARALAHLSLAALAREAGVTARTAHRLERSGLIQVSQRRRHGFVSREIWDRLMGALSRHGVELTPETDRAGSGARYARPRAKRGSADAARSSATHT